MFVFVCQHITVRAGIRGRMQGNAGAFLECLIKQSGSSTELTGRGRVKEQARVTPSGKPSKPGRDKISQKPGEQTL